VDSIGTGGGTSGILLAGGASRRFPPNKLLMVVRGAPLLWYALRPLAEVVDEIVIVVGADAPLPALPTLPVPVRIARDADPLGGPLVGLAAGLAAASTSSAVVAAGDAPATPPALLAALRDALAGTSADVIALSDGQRRSVLPSAVRVAAARDAVSTLVAEGERRLRALLDAVPVEVMPETWWRRFDEGGAWRRDIDRPEDLNTLDEVN